MAIEEAASIATANSVPKSSLLNYRTVMAKGVDGTPLGAAQDKTPTLPESISRYQVEALNRPEMSELLFVSYREKLKKTSRFFPLRPSDARHSSSNQSKEESSEQPPSSPQKFDRSLEAIPPLMRHSHVDVMA